MIRRPLIVAGLGIAALGGMGLVAVPPTLALARSVKAAELVLPSLEAAAHAGNYHTVNALLPRLTKTVRAAHADLARLQMFRLVPGIGGVLSQADEASQGLAALLAGLAPCLDTAERLWSAWSHPGTAPLPPNLLRTLAFGLDREGPPAQQSGRALLALSYRLPRGADRHLLAAWGKRLQALGRLAGAAPVIGRILGDRGDRRYLVLFEDSGELRGGGGFIAGYGYLTIAGGRYRLGGVGPIASLSRRSTTFIPAPGMLARFFGQHRLFLMNANLAPWGVEDSRTVLRMYRGVPGHLPVQGVIWVNTWAADRFLKAFGPVTVDPGGQAVTIDSRANVAMERLAYRDGAAGTRAVLLGVVARLRAILTDPAPGDRRALVRVTKWALARGDLYAYSPDPAVERLLERIGAGGGTVPRSRTNYVEVVDNNLGAHKDNFFLRQAVVVAASRTAAGRVDETIRIRWTLPHRANGWLVVPYLGWTTVYLPPGIRLLSARLPDGSPTRAARSTDGPVGFGFALRVPPEPVGRSPRTVEAFFRVRLPRGVATARRITVLLQPGQRGQWLRVGDGPWVWQTRTRTVFAPEATRTPE